MSLLEHALDLAEIGLRVFPVGPDCRSPLTPALSGRGGCHLASCKELEIRSMWSSWANVAVATGRGSGVFVLDIDRKNGVDGFKAAEKLSLNPGWISETPSGGQHWWFIQPRRPIRNRVGFLPGLDIRTDGGSVAVPPSRKPSGHYRWIKSPWSGSLTVAPFEFLELIDPPIPPPPPMPKRPSSRYVESALNGEANSVANCKSGRNQALFVSAARLSRFVNAGLLGADSVRSILEAACLQNGLLKEDGAYSVRATIESGLRRGPSSDMTIEMRRALSY